MMVLASGGARRCNQRSRADLADVDAGPVALQAGDDPAGGIGRGELSRTAPPRHGRVHQGQEHLLDGDVRAVQLMGERLRQDVQAPLGGAIDGGAPFRHQGEGGIDIDDHGLRRGPQPRQQPGDQLAGAGQVDGDLGGDRGRVEIGVQEGRRVLHGGVVDQHVDAIAATDHGIRRRSHLFSVGKVGLEDGDAGAGPLQPCQRRGGPGQDDDLVVRPKPANQFSADSGGSAGDDNALVFEFHVHRTSSAGRGCN